MVGIVQAKVVNFPQSGAIGNYDPELANNPTLRALPNYFSRLPVIRPESVNLSLSRVSMSALAILRQLRKMNLLIIFISLSRANS
jgi:hypothetical protein